MKQFIVLTAMIGLGVFICNLIAGPDDGSVMSILKEIWGSEIVIRTAAP